MQDSTIKINIFYKQMAELPRPHACESQGEEHVELPFITRPEESSFLLLGQDVHGLGILNPHLLNAKVCKGVGGIGRQVALSDGIVQKRPACSQHIDHALISERTFAGLGMTVRGDPSTTQILDERLRRPGCQAVRSDARLLLSDEAEQMLNSSPVTPHRGCG